MIPRPAVTPPVPPPIKLSKLLLVEGDTPAHFFEALLRQLGLDRQVEIRNFRGVGDFKTFVVDLASTSEFQQVVISVGVIRDAESRPAAQARQSVEAALTAAGLTPRRQPPIKTSIYILPDDANSGMIETLCVQAVQNEASLAPVRSCMQDFFTCLGKNGLSWHGHTTEHKRLVQVYLATRQKVQLYAGVAAYQPDCWPWASAVFDPLKQFLRNL